MKLLHLSAVLIFFTACSEKNAFKNLPTGPIKHHLIVASKSNGKVTAVGLKGATPKNTQVFFDAGDNHGQKNSNADGSFNIEFDLIRADATRGQFSFQVGKDVYQTNYLLKDLLTVLQNIPREPIAFGMHFDGMDFRKDHVLVATSAASTVRRFPLDDLWQLSTEGSVSLITDAANRNLNVRRVLGMGDVAVAALFNVSELVLTRPGAVIGSSKTKLRNETGALYEVNLPAQYETKQPIDAMGNGVMVTKFDKTFAHSPETLVRVDDDHFLVSFANYYQYAYAKAGTDAKVGPGIVALIQIDGDVLKTKATIELAYKNPQTILTTAPNTYLVACSGTWLDDGSGVLKTNGAGLVEISIPSTLNAVTVTKQIDLKDFALTKPSVHGGYVVIPRSWQNEVKISRPDGTERVVTPPTQYKFQFTSSEHFADNIFFITDAAGYLVAFDAKSEEFFPYPFVAPIKMSSGSNLGHADLVFRHKVMGQDYDHEYLKGVTGYAITYDQPKIPLDFMQVFGP